MDDLEFVSLGSEFDNRGSPINSSLSFISVQSLRSARGFTPLTKRKNNYNAYKRTNKYHKQTIQILYDNSIFFMFVLFNISVLSWRSVLLMEETGENHRPVASH